MVAADLFPQSGPNDRYPLGFGCGNHLSRYVAILPDRAKRNGSKKTFGILGLI